MALHAAAGVDAGVVMSEDPQQPSLQELDDRVRRLREQMNPPAKYSAFAKPVSGLGMAWLVSAHLVTGLVVGGVIGYLLDDWWGTSPAMLITFFFLGAAGGIRNVIRTAQRMGSRLTAEDHPPETQATAPDRPGPEQK